MKWRMMIVAALMAMVAVSNFEARADVVLSSRKPVFAGKYHIIDPVTKDTVLMMVFNEIVIYPNERFRNKAEEEYYWRTVRDVKRTLPYAKLINSTLQETYEYIQIFKSQKQKEDYLKKFEREVFAQYKPEMKKLTKNQGKLMIKLIDRETNQTSYYIVKAFLGTFRAGFWQTFGRFFGANLKQGFHPEKNKDDAMIERICIRVEQGIL